MKNLDTKRAGPKSARQPSPMAGGFFMAIGMLLGAGVGIYLGQPSAGMVIGLGGGGALALLIWLADRKK